jgi:NAD(P)-dependent dehydrogenase (short-subunit alcohol dehydrogenase family)
MIHYYYTTIAMEHTGKCPNTQTLEYSEPVKWGFFILKFKSNIEITDLQGPCCRIGERDSLERYECHAFRLDLTDPSSIAQVIANIGEQFKGIDVLVNNAVVGESPFRLAEGSPEEWLAMIDHNLKSTYLVTKAVLPFMQNGQWGRIVHISSNVVEDGLPGASSYATK